MSFEAIVDNGLRTSNGHNSSSCEIKICLPTIPKFFRPVTRNAHIFLFSLISIIIMGWLMSQWILVLIADKQQRLRRACVKAVMHEPSLPACTIQFMDVGSTVNLLNLNTFLFLFSNKMLVIKAEILKMLARIATREDPDQTAFLSGSALFV